MLIIQIALGIVLAILILRFWQKILTIGLWGIVGCVVVSILLVAWSYKDNLAIALGVGIFVIGYAIVMTAILKDIFFGIRNYFYFRSEYSSSSIFSSNTEKQAKDEGLLAFQNLTPLEGNPYPQEVNEHKYWIEGYLLGNKIREKKLANGITKAIN